MFAQKYNTSCLKKLSNEKCPVGPGGEFIPWSQPLLTMARLVTLDKRHREEPTNILCCSVLVPALPLLSSLLVGSNEVFVVGSSPTTEPHFLPSLPGQHQVLVCRWNMALLVQADGPSPRAACKETHPWHSGSILSPLALLLLLLLPLAFSGLPWNEEGAPEEAHT